MKDIDISFDTRDKLIGILLNILNTIRRLLPHILSKENPSLKIVQHVSIIENEYKNYINSFQKEDHTKTEECCNEGDYTELDDALRKKSKTTSDEQDKARFKQIVHNILRRVLNIVNNNPKTKYQDKSWYIWSYIIKWMLLLKAFFTLTYTECIEECKDKIDENSTIFKMTKDYMMLEWMRAPNDTKDKGGSQYKNMILKKLLGNSYVNMNNQSIIEDIHSVSKNK